jgi:hypothetical protein
MSNPDSVLSTGQIFRPAGDHILRVQKSLKMKEILPDSRKNRHLQTDSSIKIATIGQS